MQFNLFTDYVNDNDGVKRHCDVWSERERESNVAVDRAGLVTQSLISRIRMGVLLDICRCDIKMCRRGSVGAAGYDNIYTFL